jgi:hypothetical protein
MAPELIVSGVTCPGCGQKTAIIQDVWKGGGHSVLILHEECGFSQPVKTYVSDVLHRQIHKLELQHVEDLRILYITVRYGYGPIDDPAASIAEIQAALNGYFLHVHYNAYISLKDTVCPLCGGKEYKSGWNGNIWCINDHYEVLPEEYLPTLIGENGFNVLQTGASFQDVYIVSKRYPDKVYGISPSAKSKVLDIAVIECIRPTTSARNILIIHPRVKNQDYTALVDFIKNNLGFRDNRRAMFEIVVAEE